MFVTRWMVVGCVLALSGCMAPLQKTTHEAVKDYGADAQAHVGAQQRQPEAYLRDVPRLWVGSKPEPVRTLPVLPETFQQDVRFARDVPVTLRMVAEHVSTQVGIPVRVTMDATEGAAVEATDPLLQTLGRTDAGPGAFLLPHYTGTLAGLLDLVAARTGNAWRYKDGIVTIYYFDTRTYYVDAVPVTSSIESTVTNESQQGTAQDAGGGGGASGGGGSGSAGGTSMKGGQISSAKGEIEIIEATAETVKAMLSKGGKMAVSPGTSAVTVTDRPEVLDRIGTYIKSLNERLTRQVVIDVRIYQVELASAESYGIDWSTVYQSLNGRYGITTHSISEAMEGAQSLNLSIIDPTFKWNGSQLLLQALATQGSLAAKTSAGVATLSGRPVPVQVSEQDYYLASSGSVAVQNVGIQSTLTLGSTTTGTTMHLLPVILDNNDVLLQVSINLSTLKDLRTVQSGNARVEAPRIGARQFMQQVRLESGSTLVMSGFEQDTHSGDDRGIGSPRFWLAGGGANTKRANTVLVILLTPKVV